MNLTPSQFQLEHLAALLLEIQLQMLAGDYRIAARNLSKTRARLELLSKRAAIVHVDRRPQDVRTYARALAKRRPWHERGRLIGEERTERMKPRAHYYFEIVKRGAQVIRWAVVIRNLSAASWVDPQGHTWEYQGPYVLSEAESIYNLMAGKFGPPVRRAW